MHENSVNLQDIAICGSLVTFGNQSMANFGSVLPITWQLQVVTCQSSHMRVIKPMAFEDTSTAEGFWKYKTKGEQFGFFFLGTKNNNNILPVYCMSYTLRFDNFIYPSTVKTKPPDLNTWCNGIHFLHFDKCYVNSWAADLSVVNTLLFVVFEIFMSWRFLLNLNAATLSLILHGSWSFFPNSPPQLLIPFFCFPHLYNILSVSFLVRWPSISRKWLDFMYKWTKR